HGTSRNACNRAGRPVGIRSAAVRPIIHLELQRILSVARAEEMRAVVAARLHIRGAIDAGTRINGGRPCRSDAESYSRRRAINSEGRGITGQRVPCLVGRDDSELNAALVPGAEIRLRDREVADLLLRRLTCR